MEVLARNTGTKIIMRIEDPEKAMDATKFAGSHVIGGVEEVDRIKFLDVHSQDEGEMHVVYKDQVVKAKGFTSKIPKGETLLSRTPRVNQFIGLGRP